MKRIIIFTLLFAVSFSKQTFAHPGIASGAASDSIAPAVLIIDAEISVILIPQDSPLQVSYKRQSFLNALQFKTSGDTLTLSAGRHRNLLTRDVVYIPANRLKDIHIKKYADVKSEHSLEVPHLNVFVQSPCLFNITNRGEIYVSGSHDYVVEYSKQVRPLRRRVLL